MASAAAAITSCAGYAAGYSGVSKVEQGPKLTVGGGGLLLTALLPTLWYASGVPFAVATVGVFVHRFFSLWLFMPLALSPLPTLRALGGGTRRGGTSDTPGEPALQQ